jgi:hypothetical protein
LGVKETGGVCAMKTKEIINSRNNGSPYFGVRILITDKESYDRVTWYLKETAIKTEASEDDALIGKVKYIFDEERKQVARTNPLRRIIELTKDVKEEIRSKIEKIISGY